MTTLAERYNVTKGTVRKWGGREHMHDRSQRPNTLSTTLTPARDAVVAKKPELFVHRAYERTGLDTLRFARALQLQSVEIHEIAGQMHHIPYLQR